MSLSPDQITIRNFRQITPWFYRGGQPRDEEFEQLSTLGIKTVICLRWNRKAVNKELLIGKELNLNVISIPLTYWRLPNRSEIDEYFSIIDNVSNHPVFLHCKHGSDRTGMLASFYRIRHEGWSADRAYDEMKEAGFHKIKMHHFKYAVYRFARGQIS